MGRVLYAIDDQGFMTYETIEVEGEDTPSGYVDVPLPTDELGNQLPFWKPKWTGVEWVEAMSQEEIDEITRPRPTPPTELDVLREKVNLQEMVIEELMFDIIPTMIGGKL